MTTEDENTKASWDNLDSTHVSNRANGIIMKERDSWRKWEKRYQVSNERKTEAANAVKIVRRHLDSSQLC